ncbi:glycosyltransferase [Aliivibrio fischeri]|uniref:glycosyltransferase n=1 Tax=Aliivibrio fischeri TaxID=668 RepID=UPI0007C508C8|nr:glycosyltransferase [Aliivibrio fischeri]
MKKIAIMCCVYKSDSASALSEALESVRTDSGNLVINIYLHVDGPIGSELEEAVRSCNAYKIVRSETNIGLAAGLNKIISELEDEDYYFRMDADDISIYSRMNKQISFMECNEQVDLLGGGIIEFESTIENVVYERNYPETDALIKEMMFKASPIAHVTVCFRKDFFTKFGCYPTDYPFNEDIAFWTKLALLDCTFANLSEPLVYVRMDGAYDRRSTRKALPEFRVYWKYCLRKNKIPFYALFRLIFRYMPVGLVKLIYNSSIRRFITR